MSSPTARALMALESIQNRPGITGDELASRLGVSDRAARRYVGILREAEIPVESAVGRYGGYRIGRGVRPAPLMFTAAEALGLAMAVVQAWHGPVDGDHPVASALRKITRVLPASSSAPVEAVRRVSAQNPGDAAAVPDPQLTATVAQACESRTRLVVRYGRRDMELDPWAVVVRHGRWYLLCWSRTADARRVLRLDRMAHVETAEGTCTVPDGLDPVRDVEAHLADGWTHPAEVRVGVPLDVAARWVPRTLGRLTATEGGCVLHGSTDDPQWYAGQLAALPVPFTVVGSTEIRAAVAALAERLARAAEPGSTAPAASRGGA